MQIENNKSPSLPVPAAIEPPLTSAARSALRARAHILDPVVMVSAKGLSDAVLAEIDRSLNHHALIKIRVLDAGRVERAALLDQICSRTGAAPIQHIGKILIVYRPIPVIASDEDPRAAKPAASKTVRAASTTTAPRRRSVDPRKAGAPVIRRRRIPSR